MSLLNVNPWPEFYAQIVAVEQLYSRSPHPPETLSQSRILTDRLTQFFQDRILPQSGSAAVPSAVQPYITEIHRQLRLMAADLSLYGAARTEALQKQRLEQLIDRVNQLARYSQAMEQALRTLSETKASPESPPL
jgi:hypothetical protein